MYYRTKTIFNGLSVLSNKDNIQWSLCTIEQRYLLMFSLSVLQTRTRTEYFRHLDPEPDIYNVDQYSDPDPTEKTQLSIEERKFSKSKITYILNHIYSAAN